VFPEGEAPTFSLNAFLFTTAFLDEAYLTADATGFFKAFFVEVLFLRTDFLGAAFFEMFFFALTLLFACLLEAFFAGAFLAVLYTGDAFLFADLTDFAIKF